MDDVIEIRDPSADRNAVFDLIPWWDSERLREASVMVVGAGALGNEAIKDLALVGLGNCYIVDSDHVESGNLARSPLFRESDAGRAKADVAAKAFEELNPDGRAVPIVGDFTRTIGRGLLREMDLILGCVDNRLARLAINRTSWSVGRPWVDAALGDFTGSVGVFSPPHGACYECGLTDTEWQLLEEQVSCERLRRQGLTFGKTPTTPTMSAIVSGIQVQEGLKILHGIDLDPGSVIHYDGWANEANTSIRRPREDCQSHWLLEPTVEIREASTESTVDQLLQILERSLGINNPQIDLWTDIVTRWHCPQCGAVDPAVTRLDDIDESHAICAKCSQRRVFDSVHTLSAGLEINILGARLSTLGVPDREILTVRNKGSDDEIYIEI